MIAEFQAKYSIIFVQFKNGKSSKTTVCTFHVNKRGHCQRLSFTGSPLLWKY